MLDSWGRRKLYQQFRTSSTGMLCSSSASCLVKSQTADKFLLNLRVIYSYVDYCTGLQSKNKAKHALSTEMTTHVPLSCQNASTFSNRSNILEECINKIGICNISCQRDDIEYIITLTHSPTFHNKVKIYSHLLIPNFNHTEYGGPRLLCSHVVVTSIAQPIQWQDLIEDAACFFHVLHIGVYVLPWVLMQLDSQFPSPVVHPVFHNSYYVTTEISAIPKIPWHSASPAHYFRYEPVFLDFIFTCKAVILSNQFGHQCSPVLSLSVRFRVPERRGVSLPHGLLSLGTSILFICVYFDSHRL